MSHLAKIVAVKSALLDLGVTCPLEQAKAIESVFVKACISFIFRTSRDLSNPDDTTGEQVKAQLARWNEVSPINGQLIMNATALAIRQHYKEGCEGGHWSPITYYVPDNATSVDFGESVSELFSVLVQELCNKET